MSGTRKSSVVYEIPTGFSLSFQGMPSYRSGLRTRLIGRASTEKERSYPCYASRAKKKISTSDFSEFSTSTFSNLRRKLKRYCFEDSTMMIDGYCFYEKSGNSVGRMHCRRLKSSQCRHKNRKVAIERQRDSRQSPSRRVLADPIHDPGHPTTESWEIGTACRDQLIKNIPTNLLPGLGKHEAKAHS